WQPLARATGAIKHELKEFKSEGDLLRVLLIPIGKGYSLRETTVIAKAAGLADISDVALLKRLRKSEGWLLGLCQTLLRERGLSTPMLSSEIRLRLVDGSIIKEPGKTGSQWRLHFSFTLPEFRCDTFKISPNKGEGTGESFTHYPIQAGDYLMGDRGYAQAKGIAYIASHNAYVLVRVNTASLPLYEGQSEKPFALLEALSGIKQPLEAKEWSINVKAATGPRVVGRLCALRKSEQAIAQAQKKLIAKASKKQQKLKPETLEYAKYVILFSTYPKATFSTQEVLEWYRLRWPVELVFKRLKTLLEMGHLPKFDPASSRAWLYGKLFLALLTEKLARITRAFSPWGYPLS
ncbi:MAG: IS4 family transposase, partial [Aestuariibacter sp.]|nr:IS4 family transposase [Aestuariibacter sp.]